MGCEDRRSKRRLPSVKVQAGRRATLDGIGRQGLRQRHGESFFATEDCELLEGEYFRNRVEAKMRIFDFIEG
jgi:hypothetical protein